MFALDDLDRGEEQLLQTNDELIGFASTFTQRSRWYAKSHCLERPDSPPVGYIRRRSGWFFWRSGVSFWPSFFTVLLLSVLGVYSWHRRNVPGARRL